MSIAKKLLKDLHEDDGCSCAAVSNPISYASMINCNPDGSIPADKNGLVPDASLIGKKKDKETTKKKRFFNGEFVESIKSEKSIASRILEDNDINVDKAWHHQFQMQITPNKVTADQLKVSDVPLDILNILLMADPASANSLIYKVQGAEIDKICKVISKLEDNITVVQRSGSIVVFDGRNNAYSYNREALTNLLLSKSLKK